MKDLICNQREIPKEKWRYGLRSSAATGCGWIAAWNALRLLGHTTDIDGLIRYFQWQLPLIHGNAGTSFWGPAVCFRQWGFPVELCMNRHKFDEVLNRSDAAILFYHWRRGIKFGAHFVALNPTEQGIISYNTYRNSTGPAFLGTSVEGWLRRRKHFGCVLIGIRRKP